MVRLVLWTLPLLSHADSRRSRLRLQRAGGAAELAAAFQDDRLGWEPREQAVGLLQDLAAALAQVRLHFSHSFLPTVDYNRLRGAVRRRQF